MRRFRIIRPLLAVLAIIPAKAFALNIQTHRYYFHGGRADMLVESAPAPRDTLNLSLGTNLSLSPLEFGNAAGLVGNTGIVDYAFTFDVGIAHSVSDNVAVALNLPAHVTDNTLSLTNLAEETATSFGDISLAGQIRVLDRERTSSGIGAGVVPYITFPTGARDNFVGDAHVTTGVLLIADGEWNGHYAGLNLGVRFRQEENLYNLRVAQEFLYAAAYHHAIIPEARWDAFAEVAGSTVMNDFLQSANASPVELKIGTSKTFFETTPLKLKLVNGMGLGNGYGNPDYRVVLQLSHDRLLPRTKIIEKTVTIEKVEERLKELTIYYPTDGAQVDPYYDQKIAGIAQVMRESPEFKPLYIVGHTDDVGSDAYNRRLSERRAREAYDAIMQYGPVPEDVLWTAVGEGEPAVPNTNEPNRALNRRTVFTFQKPVSFIRKEESAGAARDLPRTKATTGSDSFTEVLKEKGEGFVDDTVVPEPVKTRERIRVKEETRVKEDGGDDDADEGGRKSIKGKTFRNDDDVLDEKTLQDEFREPPVE